MSKLVSKYYFLSFLVLVAIILVTISFDLPGKLLTVHFLDIGQGDSFLIFSPSGNQILIDGGPDRKILDKLGQYLPFYDRTIEMVILTHPQADHLSGLVEVLKRYKVEKVLSLDVDYDSALFREWKRVLKENSVSFISAQAGQIIDLGGGTQFLIFYPNVDLNGQLVSSDEINDLSIVGKLVYKNFSILFTGDGEIKEELALVKSGLNLKSSVLKIGHHGSKTSSHLGFLKSVKPEVAVISVGRNNKFGHPKSVILDRLNNLGIKIMRTDLIGDIILESDGLNYSF